MYRGGSIPQLRALRYTLFTSSRRPHPVRAATSFRKSGSSISLTNDR